jgi:hypothetical protein
MKTSSADGIDAIAISEKAKQQIGSLAAKSDAKLQGPSFLDGTTPPSQNTGSLAVNVAAVHWADIEKL